MNKGTLILFSIVLALAGATYALYQRSEDQKQAQKQASMLFGNLETSQIKSARLQAGQKEIRLQKHRTDSRWYVMAPVKDRADDRAVEDFLTALKEQSINLVAEASAAEEAGESEEASKAQENFGLHRSYWSVHLVDQKGRPWRVQISAKRAFDGSLYLQKNDPNKKTPSPKPSSKETKTADADSSASKNQELYLPQVYTAGEDLVSLLEKKTNEFQSKMMFEKDSSITESQFKRVNLKHKSRSNLELHLEKNQVSLKSEAQAEKVEDAEASEGGDQGPVQAINLWQLRGRHHEPLEQQRVEDFLESIKLFHADEVIENQKTGDLYEKYHLYKPDFKIEVEHEKGLWELRISEGKDKFVYMTSSSSLGIYKMSLSAAEVLYRKEDSFLDFAKPFVFDTAQVKKIQMNTSTQHNFVLNDNNTWQQTSADKATKGAVKSPAKEPAEAPEKADSQAAATQDEAAPPVASADTSSSQVSNDHVNKLIENLRELQAEKFYSPKSKIKFTKNDKGVEFKSLDDELVFSLQWRQLGSNYAAATNIFDGVIEVDKAKLDESLNLQLVK